MPSRFIGIDQDIEAQNFYRDFHLTFLLHLRRAIHAQLPDSYDARAEEELVTIQVDE